MEWLDSLLYGIVIVSMIASIIALVVAIVATISSNYNARERVSRWLFFAIILFVMFGSAGLMGNWVEGIRYSTRLDALGLVLLIGSAVAIAVLTWIKVHLTHKGRNCVLIHKCNKCKSRCLRCGKKQVSKKHQYEMVGTCTRKCIVCGDVIIEHQFDPVTGSCERKCAQCSTITMEHNWRYEERTPACNGCGQCDDGDINNYGRLGCQRSMEKVKICTVCGTEERVW